MAQSAHHFHPVVSSNEQLNSTGYLLYFPYEAMMIDIYCSEVEDLAGGEPLQFAGWSPAGNSLVKYISSQHCSGFVCIERQCQCCDDASDTSLTENNPVVQKWVATPF